MLQGINLNKWSERQQVLAVITLAGGVIFMLYFFLLLPQYRLRHRLEAEINKMKSELEKQSYLLTPEEMARIKARETENYNQINQEWETMVVSNIDIANVKLAALSEMKPGHLEYKQAYFEMREHLSRKAHRYNVPLPAELGITDQVTSDADTRKMMLQLKSLFKLVSLLIELEPTRIVLVKTEPPPSYCWGNTTDCVFMEEYPVRIEFESNIKCLYNLLKAICTTQNFFTVRNFQVEPLKGGKPDMLKVSIVAGGLHFPLAPSQIRTSASTKKTERIMPAGH
jgi:Tfp pilus assembly protein PilO